MIDSGASNVFVAAKIARKMPKSTQVRLRRMLVKLPNGQVMESTRGIQVPYRIGTFHSTITARVLDMQDYQFILGLSWLKQWNPDIDWNKCTVTIQDLATRSRSHVLRSHREIHELQMDEIGTDAQFQLGSFSAIRRVFAREKQAFLYLIRVKYSQEEARFKVEALVENGDKELTKIVHTYRDRFQTDETMLPPRREHDHAIPTGTAPPINLAAYRLSPLQQEELQRQVESLLARGLIRPSGSEWGCPVIFVPKPGGKWRMCIDYRALNKVTTKDTYPLPRIDECIDSFGGAQYYTKLDLLSGYWQVRIKEEDIPKTAFNTRHGKYEFMVMPMGLTNAPATFQAMMNRILHPYLFRSVVVYLDDIVIYSKTKEEHYKHVREVLQVLQDHDLYAHPDKCTIGAKEITFCGHRISQGRIQPMQDKINIIKDWPMPTNVHEVRQFLGLASYYRKFIKNFARIALPLFDLLKEMDPVARKKKFRPIQWNAQCSIAFTELKRRLTSKPVLIQADNAKPFLVETDASDFAIGYACYQEDTQGVKHPVAFNGRKLQGAELNYPVHEKELLAIKEALRVYRHYIEGKRTVILTDHQSLRYMETNKNPSKRMARWIEEFQGHDLDIQYRKGVEAIVPDALSRRPDFHAIPVQGQLRALREQGLSPKQAQATLDLLSAQIRDKKETRYLNNLRKALVGEELPTEDQKEFTRRKTLSRFWLDPDEGIRKRLFNFSPKESLQARRAASAPFIPAIHRQDFVKRMHNQYGHLAWPGLNGAIEPHGWWPGMAKDINEHCKFCPQCQLTQPSRPNRKNETQFHRVSKVAPFESWGIDLIGELPLSINGNRWIICAIDYATSWPVVQAVPSATAEVVAQFIYEKIYIEYGPPRILTSDNGPQFIGRVLAHLLQQVKTKHHLTAPYNPRANGKVERYNGLLGKILTKMLVNDYIANWDTHLPAAVYATRVRAHRTSKFSPFYLVYGRYPRDFETAWEETDQYDPGPAEAPNEAEHEERIKKVRTARQLHLEQLLGRAVRSGLVNPQKVSKEDMSPKFATGDQVLLRNLKKTKFRSHWLGPYNVVKSHPLGTYALATPNGDVLRNLVHGDRLTGVPAQFIKDKNFWAKLKESEQVEGDVTGTEIDTLIDDENKTWKDLQTMTRQEWDTVHTKWSGEKTTIAREGPRRFQEHREDTVDIARLTKESLEKAAKRLRTEAPKLLAERGRPLAPEIVSTAFSHEPRTLPTSEAQVLTAGRQEDRPEGLQARDARVQQDMAPPALPTQVPGIGKEDIRKSESVPAQAAVAVPTFQAPELAVSELNPVRQESTPMQEEPREPMVDYDNGQAEPEEQPEILVQEEQEPAHALEVGTPEEVAPAFESGTEIVMDEAPEVTSSLIVDEPMPTIEDNETSRVATPEEGPATKRAKRAHDRTAKWRHKRTTFVRVPEEEFQPPTAFEAQAIEVRVTGGRELRQRGKRTYAEYHQLIQAKARARVARAIRKRERKEKQERE
jgi:hypothetical protein